MAGAAKTDRKAEFFKNFFSSVLKILVSQS